MGPTKNLTFSPGFPREGLPCFFRTVKKKYPPGYLAERDIDFAYWPLNGLKYSVSRTWNSEPKRQLLDGLNALINPVGNGVYPVENEYVLQKNNVILYICWMVGCWLFCCYVDINRCFFYVFAQFLNSATPLWLLLDVFFVV